MLNIFSVLLVLLLAALFFFLAIRAGRAWRAWIKWPGMLLSGVLGLLFLAIGGVAIYGFYQLNVAPYRYTVSDIKVAGTPEQIARGEKLAIICADCHSSTRSLPLGGSTESFLAGGPPLGTLYAPNLTPGGRLKDWSDGEILRAIREGVSKDGRPLIAMTSEPFSHMSDEDAQAIVAYLRSQPAIVNDTPKTDMNILAALFIGAGLFPTSAQPPITAPVVAPAPGTPEYGKYLVYSAGCRDCHGPQLAGPEMAFVPPGPNLTATISAWSEDQFLTFFKTGTNNTGRLVDTMSMPWETYSHMFSEADLRDMYSYLSSLPRVESPK